MRDDYLSSILNKIESLEAWISFANLRLFRIIFHMHSGIRLVSESEFEVARNTFLSIQFFRTTQLSSHRMWNEKNFISAHSIRMHAGEWFVVSIRTYGLAIWTFDSVDSPIEPCWRICCRIVACMVHARIARIAGSCNFVHRCFCRPSIHQSCVSKNSYPVIPLSFANYYIYVAAVDTVNAVYYHATQCN